MALLKTEIVDLIEVVENGIVQVRTRTAILEDGVEISSKFHRHTIVPGQNYSQETNRVKAVCAAVHDKFTVGEYEASQVVLDAPAV